MRKWLDAVELISEDVDQKQLNDLEKFGDRLLKKFNIDIEFTRHFADRMNDTRNSPAIKVTELQRLFKKIAKNKGKGVKKHGDAEAVLKDMQSDLNLPVVVNYKDGEFEMVNKTIMRKKNFKTTSPVVQYEGQDPDIKSFKDMYDEGFMDTVKSKTINKKEYQHALMTLKKLLTRKSDEKNLTHSTEYYAQKVAKSYSGMNDKALHSMLGKWKP